MRTVLLFLFFLLFVACSSRGPAATGEATPAPTPQQATLADGSTLRWGPTAQPHGRAQFELALDRGPGLGLALRFGPDGFERSARAGDRRHELAVEGHPDLGWRLWLDGRELRPLSPGPFRPEAALVERGVPAATRELILHHPGWDDLAEGLAARGSEGGSWECDLDRLAALARCVSELCSKPHPAAAPACGYCASALSACMPSPEQE